MIVLYYKSTAAIAANIFWRELWRDWIQIQNYCIIVVEINLDGDWGDPRSISAFNARPSQHWPMVTACFLVPIHPPFHFYLPQNIRQDSSSAQHCSWYYSGAAGGFRYSTPFLIIALWQVAFQQYLQRMQARAQESFLVLTNWSGTVTAFFWSVSAWIASGWVSDFFSWCPTCSEATQPASVHIRMRARNSTNIRQGSSGPAWPHATSNLFLQECRNAESSSAFSNNHARIPFRAERNWT
jgi:hypothetical protein